jgi:predicted dehydrogenase
VENRREFVKNASVLALAAAHPVHVAGADTIRVGVIGCGGRGTEAALQAMTADDGVRLVAMADIVPERIREKREQLKAKKPDQVAVKDEMCFSGFDAYRHVIEASDVVLIANAAKFHPLHTMAALRAGRHVFVEKPHAIDPAGVQTIRAAADLAKEKRLSLVSGLQSRFHPGYRETVQRIHDGAIGDIVAIQETWLRAPYVLYPRQSGMNEVEYQASNQYHFHWLCGDDVPQTLIHNLDRARWALRDQDPVRCYGMGGRSTLKGEIYGNVFDHHAVVYEFGSGVRLYAYCRTIPNCYGDNSSLLMGTKGRANITQTWIQGEMNWKYTGPRTYENPGANPYQIEHNVLFQSIRAATPFNSGAYMARSTLIGVMGQISCYTGQEVRWANVSQSDFFYPPRPEDVSVDMDPPVRPGPDGTYPVFVPGVTKLL